MFVKWFKENILLHLKIQFVDYQKSINFILQIQSVGQSLSYGHLPMVYYHLLIIKNGRGNFYHFPNEKKILPFPHFTLTISPTGKIFSISPPQKFLPFPHPTLTISPTM